jgi:hypothetical protein
MNNKYYRIIPALNAKVTTCDTILTPALIPSSRNPSSVAGKQNLRESPFLLIKLKKQFAGVH